ncbi:glutamate receptor ionotropic, delta-1 [Caerostris extrusa]|uniref:Glutamate receptor ionotropic, delta-1 n=1 Tax=Caerostris extrusa TaxID=172846 RepID=A0AAV4TMM5_CAEEX|nr:glutamate receptor ionotropic, delta-1 [Caerostris extrusa]
MSEEKWNGMSLNSVKELPVTVKTLLKELTKRGIRYSYLVSDSHIDWIVRKLEAIKRGSKELTIIVLADFSDFKMVLDGIYEHRKLNSDMTYVIVNDGWEVTNPEMETPQRVRYSIDLQLLLLKRKIGETFSQDLARITANSEEKSAQKWKVGHFQRLLNCFPMLTISFMQ